MPADPSIPIRRRNRPSTHLGDALHRLFVTEKLNNWLGWLIMAGVATVFGYLIAEKTVMGLSLFGLVFGLFVFIACVINTEAGLYINIAYSFFASQFSRYLFHDEFPVGVVTDILILATFMSLLFRTQFLKTKLEEAKAGELKEWVHFGLTSQDINNTAIPLSWKYAVEFEYLPALLNFNRQLKLLAK